MLLPRWYSYEPGDERGNRSGKILFCLLTSRPTYQRKEISLDWLPNPYQLKTLLAVAKYHSFRDAADEQHVTVSAISQQMLTLSRETRTVLYERRGNKTYLTAAGLNLAEYARHIVQLSEEAVAAMAEPPEPREMRVSLVTSVAEGILPQLYSTFRTEQTDTTFRIQIKPGTEIIDELNAGSADVALLPSYDGDTSAIERLFHERVVTDQLVAVVQDADTLASRDSLTVQDLSGRRLFLESQRSPNCLRLLQRFREERLAPVVELFCSNNSLAIRMALSAGHVAVVPEIVARTSRDVHKYLPIVDGVSRSLLFCCPKFLVDEPLIAAFRNAVHTSFRSA